MGYQLNCTAFQFIRIFSSSHPLYSLSDIYNHRSLKSAVLAAKLEFLEQNGVRRDAELQFAELVCHFLFVFT